MDLSKLLMEGKAGQSSNRDILINDPKKAKKFSQSIMIKGVVHEFHYQGLKLQVMDEYAARKLMQEVNSEIDIEEGMKIEKNFLKGKCQLLMKQLNKKKKTFMA